MDCNHKYLAYIKLFNMQLNNIMFVSLVHSGTIYLYQPDNNNYYYINCGDIEDIAAIYSGQIPIIIIPSIKGSIKQAAIGYQDILKKLTYILDGADVQYLRNSSDNLGMLYNAPELLSLNIIIALHINNDSDFTYINNILARFYGADIIICAEDDTIFDKIITSHSKILTYIKTSINNHMVSFLHALNYIYSRNLRYDYVFKLYYHTDFIINYETLNLKITNHDVIGYPAIKYDYLDNNYVFQIINDYKLTDTANINKLYSNIKTLASRFSLPTQINRKTKDWANISKKTNKSYIPSSIFIIKFDKIPFEIIDSYAIACNDSINAEYEQQSYINALNKILTIFEY